MKIKILISEDNTHKTKLLINELKDSGVDEDDILVATNGVETRRALKDNAGNISLLLLDLVLPNREGDIPTAEVGFEILRQILEDGEYHPPANIVGTTADSEAMLTLESEFKKYTTQILMVTPDESDWKFSLKKIIQRITWSIEQPKDHLVDVCFVTALRKPELEAILELPINWSPEQSMGNGVLFQEGTANIQGVERKFICAHSTQMGMVAASFMTRVLWEKFFPRVMIMTGICGGLKGVNLGDVIVADRSWDWQSGKWMSDGTFDAAPDHKEAAIELIALARGANAIATDFWRSQDHRPQLKPEIRVGPMLSGSAVVEDPNKHELFLRQHRKAIAVDMECYGFYFSTQMSSEISSKTLCIKAVSDLADRSKDDNYQLYCSRLSATVAFDVVQRFFK